MCDFSVEAVNNKQQKSMPTTKTKKEEKKRYERWTIRETICVWLITLSVCLMSNYKYDSLIDTNHKICRRTNKRIETTAMFNEKSVVP